MSITTRINSEVEHLKNNAERAYRSVKMKIGLSLPSNYLSGTYNDPVSSIYYSALGPIDSGLFILELQPKKYAATGSVQELLLSSIRILREAGL